MRRCVGGPVDVYVDGTLLLTAPLTARRSRRIARVGLGVEERVRVARNVVVKETTRALVARSVAVEHQISIELRSSSAVRLRSSSWSGRRSARDDDLAIDVAASDLKSSPTPRRNERSDPRRPALDRALGAGEKSNRELELPTDLSRPHTRLCRIPSRGERAPS